MDVYLYRSNPFLMENRHILYHLIDIRPSHVEEFNMLLILLIVSTEQCISQSSTDADFL